MSQEDRLLPQDSMEQIRAFASSTSGKQLIAMLQKHNGNELNKARQHAAAGDLDSAKRALSSMLSDPQVRALLKQFGG